MTAIELGSATYGTRKIAYRVERSQRRVSAAIIVDPSEGVIVRVPPTLAKDKIEALVRRKAVWVVARARAFEDLLPTPAPREFIAGETFHYLGRQYRLRIERVAGVSEARVLLARGRLVVRVPEGVDGGAQAAVVRAALRGWYRRRAAAYLPRRLAHWATRLNVSVPKPLIREPPKRWGSCDAKGNVRINWRVMQVAPRLVDYVLAHELVHLEHRRHDSDFWARLGEAMHDAEARRESLRKTGATCDW